MKWFSITAIMILTASNVWAQEEVTAEEAIPDDKEPGDTATESAEEGTDAPAQPETDEAAEPAGEEASEEPAAQPETAAAAEEGDVEESSAEASAEEEVDPASDPPVVTVVANPDDLNTRVSGRFRSELFMSQKPRVRHLGGGSYGVRSDNVFPFYETIELRADEIGHKGLSIHFQGWAGLDLADVYFDQRFVADPTYLYLQFRDYGADIKLGRQAIYSGTTQGLTIDGIYASYESPIHLGIEALGGLVVSPYRGPEWYREQPANLGYDDFGAGFSDWEREGDYAVGGRLFYRMSGKVSAGASILHVTELDEVDRQLFGIDLDMTPLKWFGATGNATMDLLSTRLREANLALDFYPIDVLTLSVEYRHADPTLYLSHMSIFSVFSIEEYDSVGGMVRLKPLDWLGIHAGYHQRFYSYIEDVSDEVEVLYTDEIELGYEVNAGVSSNFGMQQAGLVLLDYRRLGGDEQGINQLRLGTMIPLGMPQLRASANVYLDFYDEEVNEADVGFLGDLGLFYGNETIEAGGSMAVGANPYAQHEVRGMLKFNYNFDVSFVERRQP